MIKKIAFIGCGFTSQISHLPSFYKIKNCKIIAIAEKRKKIANYICKKYKIRHHYSDHEELLKNHKNELDGVVIIVRREETYKLAKFFLKNNINVFTEKPMAKTYLQCKDLHNISKKKKLIYQIGYNKLFDDGIILAKKIIKKNNLGNLIYFRYHNITGTGYVKNQQHFNSNEKYKKTNQKLFEYPKWLNKRNFKIYDEYLNTNSHTASVLNFIFNKAPNIDFVNLKKTNQLVVLNYGNFYGTIESKHYKDYEWSSYLKLYYDGGYIKILLPPQQEKNKSAKILIKKRDRKIVEINPINRDWSFYNQAKYYIKCLLTKKIQINNSKKSLSNNILIEKIFKFYEKKNI